MKKSLLSTLIFSLIFSFTNKSFAIKENKIIRVGYVNYAKVVEKATQNGKVFDTINALKQSYDNQINELTNQVNALSANLQNGVSESNVSNQISQLDQKRIELNILQAKAITDVAEQTDKLLAPIKEKISALIALKAKQLGFDIIFDSSIIMVGSTSLDLTNIILASI